MSEARHDPVVHRFVPDVEMVAQAQQLMMQNEDAMSPLHRYIRQQWEAAWGATRVALDALRLVWPYEADGMTEEMRDEISNAVGMLESAYRSLDGCSEEMLGLLMDSVLRGIIRTQEELDTLRGICDET